MIKLTEVVRNPNPGFTQRYNTRSIFINPSHVSYIRPYENDSSLKESFSNSKSFCCLLLGDEKIIVMGSLVELQERIFSGRKLLNG